MIMKETVKIQTCGKKTVALVPTSHPATLQPRGEHPSGLGLAFCRMHSGAQLAFCLPLIPHKELLLVLVPCQAPWGIPVPDPRLLSVFSF